LWGLRRDFGEGCNFAAPQRLLPMKLNLFPRLQFPALIIQELQD
jgi:hypothetical protein